MLGRWLGRLWGEGEGGGERWDEREESNKDKNYMVRLSVICDLVNYYQPTLIISLKYNVQLNRSLTC